MKLLIIFLLTSAICYGQSDSTAITQEVFFSPLINKYGLVTNNGSSYDNVVHGTLEFVEQQKEIEYQKARRKPIRIVTVKCKSPFKK